MSAGPFGMNDNELYLDFTSFQYLLYRSVVFASSDFRVSQLVNVFLLGNTASWLVYSFSISFLAAAFGVV